MDEAAQQLSPEAGADIFLPNNAPLGQRHHFFTDGQNVPRLRVWGDILAQDM